MVLKRTVLGGIKPVVLWFLKKTVFSHTDVVGEATEILQSVPFVRGFLSGGFLSLVFLS